MGVPGPSSSRTKAISRFLAEHQDHDAGFDVGREKGSGKGRVRIVCLGCGESIEYRAVDAAESGLAARARPETRRSSPGEQERPLRRPAADRRSPGRFGGHAFAVLAFGILIAGLLLTGILLLTDDGSDQSKGPGSGSGSTSAAPAPATVATQPAEPATPPPPKPEPRTPRLHAATFDDRFSIGVPGGWRPERRGAETVLVGPGGSPEIDVYWALDDRGLADLGSSAVRFLEDRHPAGHVTAPIPTRVADLQALRVAATYPGGAETAVVLTTDSYGYLLVKRIDGNDQPYRVRQAAAGLDSFRPL
jgi:hypothetical protein